MDFVSSQISALFNSIAVVWGVLWWIVLPVVAIIIFWEFYMLHVNVLWLKKIKWKTLEIKIPKNILKTPKAMEQVFAAAHALHGSRTFLETYRGGELEYFMTFEIISHAGESHFYVRLPDRYQNVIESAIYSQYPEAEIIEVENYKERLPEILPNKNFDIFGGEWTLGNKSCYPIRTYPMFEEAVEEQRIDPIALLMETMSKLKGDEQMWFQVLIRPVLNTTIKKEGEEIVNKLLGVEKEKKKGFFAEFLGLGFTAKELLLAPLEHPSQEVKREEKPMNFKMLMMNPATKDVIAGIQEKISKITFQASVRFLFIDRQGSLKKDMFFAATGFLKQFGTQHLNFFRPNMSTFTKVYGLFKKTRVAWRKRMLYERYRDIMFSPGTPPVLNVEELASIYHFPIAAVGTTELEKIPSRKGGPPANLPTVD